MIEARTDCGRDDGVAAGLGAASRGHRAAAQLAAVAYVPQSMGAKSLAGTLRASGEGSLRLYPRSLWEISASGRGSRVLQARWQG